MLLLNMPIHDGSLNPSFNLQSRLTGCRRFHHVFLVIVGCLVLLSNPANLQAATGTSTWANGDSSGVWSSTSTSTDWNSTTIPNAPGWIAQSATGSGNSGTVTLDMNATAGQLNNGGNSGGNHFTVAGTAFTLTLDGTGLGANKFGDTGVAALFHGSSINALIVQPSIVMSNTDLDIGTTYGTGGVGASNVVGVVGVTTLNNAGSTGNAAAPHNLFIKGAGAKATITTVFINSDIGTAGAGIVVSNSIGSGYVLLAGSLGPDVTGLFHNSTGSILVLAGTNNTYSGDTTITSGTLRLGAANTIPNGATAGNVNVNGTLDLNGFSDTINGLSGTGIVDTLAGGTPTLTVGGNNANTTFNGVIQDSAGALRLTKIGKGVLTLNGVNTSSGSTTVSNGALLVNGSLGTNSVTVCANATLGGSGTIGGAVAIQANGQLAPGADTGSAGTVLTLSNQLTLASGSLTTMKVQTGNVGDRIATGGALIYGGALVVTNAGGALALNDHFTLFSATNYSGNLSSLALPALGAGLGWSNSLSRDGSLTVVAGTVGPAAVTNLAATGVQFTSATLNGRVTSTGFQTPTVTMFYGPADGGTNPAVWSQSTLLGLADGNFSCTVTGLTSGATYYFTAAATNDAGLVWAAPSQSFTTPTVVLATVSNLSASVVRNTSATLNGQIISTGYDTPTVTLYYGPGDGGANPAAWSRSAALGPQSGSFSFTATGLATNTPYYFTVAASNSAGVSWASPSQSFTTLASYQPIAGFMPPQSQIMSDLVLANNNFTNHWPTPGCSSCLPGGRPSAEWTRGTYMEGDLALYRLNQDANIYNYAVQWGALVNWVLSDSDTGTDPNGHCAGQSYTDLYLLAPIQADTNRLTHIVNNVNYWVSNNIGLTAWSFVDAIHMSMPALAKLSALNSNTVPALKNNATFSPAMYSWFHNTKSVIGPSNGLYNITDRLWWRDATFVTNYTAQDGTKQKCYWSRGNGWAMVSLCRTMDALPVSDPHYAEYLQTFTNMAAALKAVQRADGFWNVNLAYTNDYPGPEASGTASFVYGLAWGINHGYLATNDYLPSVIRGWDALSNGALHRTADTTNGAGFLGYEQDAGDKPSDGQPVTYTSVPTFTDFGLGLFLLAGTEIYPLSSSPGIIMSSPVLGGGQVQLDFTVISTLTNVPLNLLQCDTLGAGWIVNPTATLTTNVAGYSYRFTTPFIPATRFYRVQAGP